MNLSHLSCVDDVFQRCLRSTISDVFTDAKREDQRRLKNHSNIATQGFQLKITNVATVDGYPPRLWVVEPRQETHQCRLSRASGTDNRNPLVRYDAKIDLFQNGSGRVVSKGNLFKRDLAFCPL